jgi:hypothetical protein
LPRLARGECSLGNSLQVCQPAWLCQVCKCPKVHGATLRLGTAIATEEYDRQIGINLSERLHQCQPVLLGQAAIQYSHVNGLMSHGIDRESRPADRSDGIATPLESATEDRQKLRVVIDEQNRALGNHLERTPYVL